MCLALAPISGERTICRRDAAGRVGPGQVRRARNFHDARLCHRGVRDAELRRARRRTCVLQGAARVADPIAARNSKRAFPDIVACRKYAADAHVPGAAWGGSGSWRTPARSANDVPLEGGARRASDTVFLQCVDDEEFHRDGDPEAARRLKARSRTDPAQNAGDEGAAHPTADAEDHDPPPASHAEGFPEDNPGCRHRRAVSALITAGIRSECLGVLLSINWLAIRHRRQRRRGKTAADNADTRVMQPQDAVKTAADHADKH